MNAHRFQTTDDVIARSAQPSPVGQPVPHVPFARFRSTPWIVFFCILGAVGMLAGWILLAG